MGHLRLRRVGEAHLFSAPVRISLLSSTSSGSEARLLLDTGASTVFLKEELVESLGGLAGEPRYRVGGLTGHAALASVPDVKIVFGVQEDDGAIRLPRVPVLPKPSQLPVPADGVLGAHALRLMRATVTIDYETELGTLDWP